MIAPMKFSDRSAGRTGGVLLRVLIVVVVLVVVLFAAWTLFLPGIVVGKISSMSGFPAAAEKIRVNPFGTTVMIKGFKIENPPEFPDKEFLDLALLDLQVKPMSLKSERIEIPRLVINLQKVVVVTNKEGVSNVAKLKENLGPSESSDEEQEGETPEFHIGLLEVHLGSIEVVDYSKGEEPVRRVVNLDVDRKFTDVTDPKTVATPIVGDILKANAGAISSELAPLLPGEYGDAFTQALTGVGSFLGDTDGKSLEEKGKAAKDAAKKLFESFGGDGKP